MGNGPLLLFCLLSTIVAVVSEEFIPRQSTQAENDKDGNMFDIYWTEGHEELTWRNLAVSMGRGWQAVISRGVVHEDWQR